MVWQAYKAVQALVERQMAKSPQDARVNVLFVVSKICREAKRRHGKDNKYG